MLLTSREVAKLLRVHPKHVYRLLAKGLPAKRAGGKWLFAKEEVLAWAGGRGTEARAEAPGLLAANGDLAVEILLGEVKGALIGLVQADRGEGLELLEEGKVALAGCHGGDAPETVGGEAVVWIHLVDREVGLVTRARRVRSLGEIVPLRLASRPATAGVRAHFDEALERAGVNAVRVHRRALLLGSHRDVVCAVVRGDADVGLASRAWAARVGLEFTPIAVEAYGLVARARELGSAPVRALAEAAQRRSFRARLGEVAGYGAGRAGEVRFAGSK